MKPRHAAALALVGWCLMLAPPRNPPAGCQDKSSDRECRAWLKTPGPYFDAGAPLSSWRKQGCVDTAAACEKGRVKVSKAESENLARDTSQPVFRSSNNAAQVERAVQCIASDDPRLKGK
jgi:hypothetical protein